MQKAVAKEKGSFRLDTQTEQRNKIKTENKDMAKSNTIKNGTSVIFKGYSDGDGTGDLAKGALVKIIGYDPEEGTYAVEDAEGVQDSLFEKEFEVPTAAGKAPAKTAKAPKAPAKKAPKVEEEAEEADEEIEEEEEEEEGEVEEEEVAPAPKTSKIEKVSKVKTEKVAKVKAAKVAKVKAEKPEPEPLPAFKQTASVKAALEGHDGNALTAAHELAESSEKTVFTLGGVLAYIKRNELHATILGDEKDAETGKKLALYPTGIKGFNSYVQDILGLASRKAHYYVDLYEKFSQITTETKIGKIGWTKLRELIPLALDKSNVDEWVDFAKTSSTAEVRDAVVKTLVDSGKPLHGNRNLSEKTTMKLAFFDDQAAMITEALEKAREVIGSEATESQCFVHIVQEWMTMDSYDMDPEDDLVDEDDDEDA